MKRWHAFCCIVGIEDRENDLDFEPAKRHTHGEKLMALLDEIFPKRTSKEWLEELDEADILATEVVDYRSMLASEQARANGYLLELDHPTAGRVLVAGTPVTINGEIPQVARPAPELGQHTEEVMLERRLLVGRDRRHARGGRDSLRSLLSRQLGSPPGRVVRLRRGTRRALFFLDRLDVVEQRQREMPLGLKSGPSRLQTAWSFSKFESGFKRKFRVISDRESCGSHRGESRVPTSKRVSEWNWGFSTVLDHLIGSYKKAIRNCEPVGALVNDRTAAASIAVCAPTREEAKSIAKEAIDFTTRKAAELFTPFAKQEVKGYEYYKKMAELVVAAGDYRLSLADLDKRIETGAVMVGHPEDCLKVAKRYEAADADLLLVLVQVGAIPHEKSMQTIELLAQHVAPKLRDGNGKFAAA